MNGNTKQPSPIAWVLGQTGNHGGQYVLSVILAIIGVGFSVAPYFVVVGIIHALMDGQQDFSFYLKRCLIMLFYGWAGCSSMHSLPRPVTERPLQCSAKSANAAWKS